MTFNREFVEPIRRLSDREVKVYRWLASVQAMKLEAEAREYRAVELVLTSEQERREQVLAELDKDMEGGIA